MKEFKFELSLQSHPYLKDHIVYGTAVVPGATYVEMGLAVGKALLSQKTIQIDELIIKNPLLLRENETRIVKTQVKEESPNRLSYEVVSRNQDDSEGEWLTHVFGQISAVNDSTSLSVDFSDLKKKFSTPHSAADHYSWFKNAGLEYGRSFQVVQELWTSDEEALGLVRLGSSLSQESLDYNFHPVLLDGCLQVCKAIFNLREAKGEKHDRLSLPFGIERFTFYRSFEGALWCQMKERKSEGHSQKQKMTSFDFKLFNESGELVADAAGYTVVDAPKELLLKSLSSSNPCQKWLLDVRWVQQSHPAKAEWNNESWLLLCDKGGASSALLETLKQSGQDVQAVHVDQLEKFLQMPESQKSFTRIVNLSNLDLSSDLAAGNEDLIFSRNISFLQAVLKLSLQKLKGLYFITAGAQVFEKQRSVNFQQAAVWGLARTVAVENPELNSVCVDLDPDIPIQNQIQQLLSEFISTDKEDQVALRSSSRWVRRLEKSQNDLSTLSPVTVNSEVTYLITGGLGALGLKVAQKLVEQGARYLLLLGRRGPSDSALKIIQEMQLKGVHVRTLQVDVSDFQKLNEALTKALQFHPPLKGIIHAAGVGHLAFLFEEKFESFEKAYSGKVLGAWNLHQFARTLPLDFFVMFSSGAALVPAPGQGSYAAVNACLDSLAGHCRNLGIPAISVNWGLWAESGMAQQKSEIGENKQWEKGGLKLIPPNEGLEIFSQLLGTSFSQIAVIPADWEKYQRSLPQDANNRFISSLLSGGQKVAHSSKPAQQVETSGELHEKVKAASANERRNILKEFVEKEVVATLGLDPQLSLDPRKGLMAMGMDSLTAVEFRNRLKQHLGVSSGKSLPATLLFQYPTIEALVDFLATKVFVFDSAQPNSSEAKAQKRSADMSNEPIAIVGMSCRFPGGANSNEEFWQLLKEGREGFGEVPKQRFDMDQFFDKDQEKRGKTYARRAGVLKGIGIEEWDAGFFNFTPSEAVGTDPQLRMLFEVTWEALENAGESPDELFGTQTGVFVGSMWNDYLEVVREAADPRDLEVWEAGLASVSSLPGRLSYFYGFQGPTVQVDTACSSSLVAIHQACESLRSGACERAIAAGVNALSSPHGFIRMSRLRALSPTGRSLAFDAQADGYVRAEGCGAVVLKRLSDAQRDGDQIHAIIRGSAVMHGGRSASPSATNVQSQETLIRHTLEISGVSPADVSFFEAHGTGTPLGDPIEVQALGSVLSENRDAEDPLYLSSVKTNFGHAEGAAGVSGVIKTVLALQNKQIPPHVNFKSLNPNISLETIPARIPLSLIPWEPKAGKRRIAAVSSFGMTGVLAHIVLEEAPSQEQKQQALENPAKEQILTLSAKSLDGLQSLVRKYIQFLERADLLSLKDICFTSHIGRSHFEYRLAVNGKTGNDLKLALQSQLSSQTSEQVKTGKSDIGVVPKVAFLFTGQGSQYAGMAKELYNLQPAFRQSLDQCALIMDQRLDKPLLSLLFGENSEFLNQTLYTQPCLFAVEYSLAQMWRSWGVEPSAVIGHSVGEYAAAAVAGLMSLEDAIGLIVQRADLMNKLPGQGAMASLNISEEQAIELIAEFKGRVSIAAINGPRSTVIAGYRDALDAVLEKAESRGLQCKLLNVSHAFHSPQMDPMLEEFEKFASQIQFHSAKVKVISNLTGKPVAAGEVNSVYWRNHVRSPVRFHQGLRSLLDEGIRYFVEVGPQPTLCGLAALACTDEERSKCHWLPSLKSGQSDWQRVLSSLAELYVGGARIDWKSFHKTEGHMRKVQLPTYSFQRKPYWVKGVGQKYKSSDSIHPLLGKMLQSAQNPSEYIFDSVVDLSTHDYLKDHQVFGKVILPGAAFMEMAICAGTHVLQCPEINLLQFSVFSPLTLTESKRQIQTVITKEEGQTQVKILSRDENDENSGEWKLHASGLLSIEKPADLKVPSLEKIKTTISTEISVDNWYEKLRSLGLEYGPQFQNVQRTFADQSGVLSWIQISDGSAPGYLLHPALLDCCFQSIGAFPDLKDNTKAFVPVSIEQISYVKKGSESVWCFVDSVEFDGENIKANLWIFDQDGELVASVRGFLAREISPEVLSGESLKTKSLQSWMYQIKWNLQNLPPVEVASPDQSAPWLILADQSQTAEDFSRGAQAFGYSTKWISLNSDFETQMRDFEKENRGRSFRILFLAPQKQSEESQIVAGALKAVKAIANAGFSVKPRLYFASWDGQYIDAQKSSVRPWQATLSGIVKSVQAEYSAWNCTLIDLDAHSPVEMNFRALAQEMAFNGSESFVALREGRRFVARLSRLESRLSVDVENENVQLQISQRGTIDNLEFKPLTQRALNANEVEIKVEATALNFRDVLNVLGLYPGNPGQPGGECAGIVSAVGSSVSNLKVGDRVVTMAVEGGAFSTYVYAPAAIVKKLPSTLGFAEATTIPVSFLTAYYGLVRLAQVRAGQKVLIHAGAGALGLAAIQICQRAGAEVFVTVGSQEKRDLMRSLGVQHVMNSRSLQFADDVMKLTEGEGVDIILNSLSGEAIAKSFSCLKKQGVFLEVGKIGIWDHEKVQTQRSDARYEVIALDHMMGEQTEYVSQMLDEVLGLFQKGDLHPLPIKLFPVEEVDRAFRFMALGKHIGKIVITWKKRELLKENSAYIVTGGMGALGLGTARWLAERGARKIVLVGRSAANEKVKSQIAEIEGLGCQVHIRQADIAQLSQVQDLIVKAEQEIGPIKGVVHSAGVLSDGMIVQLDQASIDKVLLPKAVGALNLHEATKDKELDFFILFSSLASVLGNVGQANYSAANALLDALASERRRQGLPALSINWGPWDGAGMASGSDGATLEKMAQVGITPIPLKEGFDTFHLLLKNSSSQIVVVPVQWKAYLQEALGGSASPFLEEVLPKIESGFGNSARQKAGRSRLLEQIQKLQPLDRKEPVVKYLQAEVAKLLGYESSEIDTQKGYMQLGIDSIGGVEFRNRLKKDLNANLPATLIFDYPNIEATADFLLKEVFALEKVAVEPDRMEAKTEIAQDAVAIVGMSCRFPGGADSPEMFWNLLTNSQDAISKVPKERFDVDRVYSSDQEATGKTNSVFGGFLKQVDQFDPQFFEMSPHEATALDPQQRLLMEVAWEALENSTESAASLMGSRTGVYIGMGGSEYANLLARAKNKQEIEQHVATGVSLSVAAGRLAYFFGLEGPTITVDTACSSSLVALHMACRDLLDGVADRALAGGVSLILTPDFTVAMSKIGALSPEGHCKTFDESADGYVRSEGCAIIVLKRLSDAVKNGDQILAVIRGSAVNQDGRSSSLTAPNGKAQERVIRDALKNAKVEASEVSYIETHGTGTPLGDPIEVSALGRVYGENRGENQPLILGSVKTNIGHTEVVAGLAGVIKTVLAMNHRLIPSNLHFKKLNPNISLEEIPARIPTQSIAWEPASGKKLAGVSSFGFSGTNAHVILEEAPARTHSTESVQNERTDHVLCLSAKSTGALRALVQEYNEFVRNSEKLNLGDFCFSAFNGRSHFEERVAFVASSREELLLRLDSFLKNESHEDVHPGQALSKNSVKLGYLFTGQGSQEVGMGQELYKSEPVFRKAMDQCEEILRGVLEVPLLEVIFKRADLLQQTVYTQPALFALEYSLYQYWKSLGVEPAWVMGHSVGEYVAACVAGIMSLEDALKLIAQRAALMQKVPGEGLMAAVASDEAGLQSILTSARQVSIAAVNGPHQTVISGFKSDVEAVLKVLSEKSIRTQLLKVNKAFHSCQLDPMLDAFEAIAKNFKYNEPRIKFISNLTGKFKEGFEVNANYWREHARRPVRFSEGIQRMKKDGCEVFLEIGPAKTLTAMGQMALGDQEAHWISSLSKGASNSRGIARSLAALYSLGVKIDWQALESGRPSRQKISLPNYPFQRKRYWVELSPVVETAVQQSASASSHPLLGTKVQSASNAGETIFELVLNGEKSMAYLKDHQVLGRTVLPGAAFVEIALAAAVELIGHRAFELEDVVIEKALILDSRKPRHVQLILSRDGDRFQFRFFSRWQAAPPEQAWDLNAKGKIVQVKAEAG